MTRSTPERSREARRRQRVGRIVMMGASVLMGPVALAQDVILTQELTLARPLVPATCSFAPTVTTQLHAAGPLFALSATGSAGDDVMGDRRLLGAVSGVLATPDWHGLRAQVATRTGSHAAMSCGAHGWNRDASLALSYQVGTGGVWVGYQFATHRSMLRPAAPEGFSAGVWRGLGPLRLGLSASTQSTRGSSLALTERQVLRVDSIRSDTLGGWDITQQWVTVVDTTAASLSRARVDTRAFVTWSMGRLSVDGVLGMIVGDSLSRRQWWSTLDGSFSITSRLALVAGLVRMPATMMPALRGQPIATVGLRVSSAPVLVPATPVPALATRFETRSRRGDDVVLAVLAPQARAVEMTGSFTGWKPRRMQRASDGWWELALRLSPGTYQLNVRVDGARWSVPPGLPSLRDEFGGTVGLLVLR